RLVRMMLVRDPERRIASAREVHDALVAIRRGERLPAAIDRDVGPQRIAIADFTNISSDAEVDWLGTGIAETLTADVAQLDGVSVIPRARVSELVKTLSQQDGKRGDNLFLHAGRELHARWVVFGGFQISNE